MTSSLYKIRNNGFVKLRNTNNIIRISSPYTSTSSNSGTSGTTITLSSTDSQTDFSLMNYEYLFYPITSGISSAAFTNNSQIMTSIQNGVWGNNTYTTTTSTPDGSNSVILQANGYGYGGFTYNNSSTFTVAYWIRFKEDSDHPDFTLNSSGMGGTLFTLGNSGSIGNQINIQFEQNTGYLRPFVNGVNAAINTVSYQQTKYLKDIWHLFTLTMNYNNGLFTTTVHANGVEQFTFNLEQLLVDAYNQQYSTSVTTLAQTTFNQFFSSSNDMLQYLANFIMFLRDFIPDYYLFDIWKIYALDRELTNSEHLGFYQSPV